MGSILPIAEGNDDLVYINEFVSVSKPLLSEIANQLNNKSLALVAAKFYLEDCAIAKISQDLTLPLAEVELILKKVRITLLSACKLLVDLRISAYLAQDS